MSSITVNFLRSVGRFSILYVLAAPIYIFSTDEYKDPPKLALAILILFVVLTTLIYWKKPSKNLKWKITDRATAVAIMIVAFIYGDHDTRAFVGAGVYFYLLGHSGEWKNYNSFINHIVFRFFAGIGVLMYIVNDELWNPIFIVSNLVIVLGLIFINVNKLRNDRKFNKREEIKESILIF